MDFLPETVLLPPHEVVISDSPWRKVMGKHSPGATTAHNVEDTIEDLALGVTGGTTQLGFAGN